MAVLRAKSFSMARKSLEKWLEDYDAGKSSTDVTLQYVDHTGGEWAARDSGTGAGELVVVIFS